MAQFGNDNNGNNSNRNNTNGITYYSGLRIRNYNDSNAINISYSNGLMRVSIGGSENQKL